MRASTFVFLALFGGCFILNRARTALPIRIHLSGDPAVCDSRASCGRSTADERVVRELESELQGLERKEHDLTRALQSVTQSEKTLAALARRHGTEAVRRELSEIEAGRARLEEACQRVEIDRVTTAARLQLARSGIDRAPDDERALDRGPVEALGALAAPGAARANAPATITSRAR
jgi:hypothetical protein